MISITLKDWIERRSLPNDADLMLQMDIEGAEYKILMDAPRNLLKKFRIMVIELHGLNHIAYNSIVANKLFLPLFQRLTLDHACVHVHPNNFTALGHPLPGIPASICEIMEFTFLRQDRMLGEMAQKRTTVRIPHPLDIVNVPEHPPFFLEPYWGGGKRTLPCRLRISASRWRYRLRSYFHRFFKP